MTKVQTKEQPKESLANEEPSVASATHAYRDEVSPDSLMSDFRGSSVAVILAFTVIVHVVLVGIFSVGYLKNEILGEDTSSLSEEERLDIAVREGTTSLREIAERHGVSPQDLSSRFSKSRAPAAQAKSTATPESSEPGTETKSPETKEPDSAIEKELQKKADGPDLPDLESEDDDLFK